MAKPKREPVNVVALNWYCRGIRQELSKVACGIAVTEFSIASGPMTKESKRLAAVGMKTAAKALSSLSKETEGEALSLVKKAKTQASHASSILQKEGKLSAGQALNLSKAVRKAKEAAESVAGIADGRCMVEVSRIRI